MGIYDEVQERSQKINGDTECVVRLISLFAGTIDGTSANGLAWFSNFLSQLYLGGSNGSQR